MSSIKKSLARFVHQYKGVEGFYFLNNTGELGYIKPDGIKSVKETFPQLKDRKFIESNPNFINELEHFIRELGDISELYIESPVRDMELGYVLPSNDNVHWKSATLVLHRQVLDTIKEDHELMVRKGMKELVQAEREIVRHKGMRSIYQGFEDLINHQDASGVYKYFPALFYLSDPRKDASNSRLRIINLRWRKKQSESTDTPNFSPLKNREAIFSVLKRNLVDRGAIDPSVRA